MLEIILMGFIGNSFYKLAGDYSKSQWGYAIAGVISVYIGLMISGMLMAIGMDIVSPGSIETMNPMVLGLTAMPLALLFTWFLYGYLKKSWEKEKLIDNADVLDNEMLE